MEYRNSKNHGRKRFISAFRFLLANSLMAFALEAAAPPSAPGETNGIQPTEEIQPATALQDASAEPDGDQPTEEIQPAAEAAADPARPADPVAMPPPEPIAPVGAAPTAPRDRWLEEVFSHISVGWRIYDYSYEETSRGSPDNGDTYFGSIYRIEEDHEFFPGAFYARYSLDDHFGIGLSYDSLRAVTRDIANRGTPEEAPGDGDGTVEVTGLVLYGYGEYSFDLPLSVFAEIGVIPYSVSFDAREEWSRNGRNELSLDDSFGYFIAGGIACPIWKNLMAELFVRYTRVEVDGEWRLLGAVKDPDVNFDLSNTAYGAGLRYSF